MGATARGIIGRVASAALLALATLVVMPGAQAQMDDLTTNEITVTKVVVGQSASAVAPFVGPDERPGFGFSFQCITSDGQPFSYGKFVLFLDVGATSGTTTERVGAMLDRDDGELRCTVSEDAPTSSALAGPPTFVVDSQGDTRAADPAGDLVTGGAQGNDGVAVFPYTRTNAIAHVTFTNAYAVVTAPTFPG